jgi:hypothetical protein
MDVLRVDGACAAAGISRLAPPEKNLTNYELLQKRENFF